MAESNKTELAVLQKRKAGKAQSIIEGRIAIAEADLKKVLKTSVVSTVTSFEVLDKSANVAGKTKFSVIYLNDAGEFKTAELTADFNEKIADASLIAGQQGFCKTEVVDSDISGISENEIKIASVTDIFLTVIDKQTAACINSCGENVACLKRHQTYSCVSNLCRENFTTEFEIEIKNKIEKVLSSDFTISIKQVDSDGTSAKVEGEIEANICYITQGEEGELKTICETVPFYEEISTANLSANGTFEAFAVVQNSKTEFKNSEINASISASITIVQTTEREIETISDAFSITNELNLTYENSQFNYLAAIEHMQEKISSTAEVNTQHTTLNKVIGSSVKNLTTTNVFVADDFVTVEGLANITAFTEVGIDGTDEKTISSVDVEIPFSIKTYVGGVGTGDSVEVDASLSDIIVKHKRTNEIDVSTILKVNIFAYKKENLVLIKDVALGEEKAQPNAAISFYITKPGDTPFGISKKFSMPLESICRFNSSIEKLLIEEKELPHGTQVVVYRRKTV